jgi:hypothetical protein
LPSVAGAVVAPIVKVACVMPGGAAAITAVTVPIAVTFSSTKC